MRLDNPTAGPGKGGGDATIPLIGAAETRRALPFDALIPALKAAFAAGATVPERHHHHIPHPDGDGVLLLMPAWSGGLLGTKVATIHPANNARGLPSVHSTYLLAMPRRARRSPCWTAMRLPRAVPSRCRRSPLLSSRAKMRPTC